MKISYGKLLVALSLGLLCPLVNATVVQYAASLSGPNESPANTSTGTGFAQVFIDDVANTMEVKVTFSGLTGTTTASHIHAATATPGTGTAVVATQTPTFGGFPLGVTSGSYDQTFDLLLASTYRAGYITSNGGTAATAAAALLAAIKDGKAYLNIHTTAYPGGEIRGFLTKVVPDESATALLLTFALVGLMRFYRRRP